LATILDHAFRASYRLGFTLLRGWWWLRRPTLYGVSVLVGDGERILVVRHSYQPGLGLPGGGLARGETPAAAARRELGEETGIWLAEGELERVTTLRYEDRGRKIVCALFAWQQGTPLPQPRADGREIVWAGYLPLSELPSMQLIAGLRIYLEGRAVRAL
jgi:8-oxo-dGTP diphosphatase